MLQAFGVKVFAKFTGKGLCQRLYFNIKLHSKGCKKETLAQVFSCEFSKISKSTFFTEHLRTTASAFSFSEADTGGALWKKVFLNISENLQENTFGFRNFQKHLFYRTPLDDCFWFFRATLLKLGTANSVWKNSNEYSLSRKTNLRSTVQVYYFFFRQDKLSVYVVIGLHCLLREAATRVEVFCKKGCSWRFRKFRRKTPVLESFFNKVSGLTLILKNIGQQLLLHCTRTTHCYFIRFTFAFF